MSRLLAGFPHLRYGVLALCVALVATLLGTANTPTAASATSSASATSAASAASAEAGAGGGLPGTPSASSSAAGAGPALAFDGNHATTWTAAGSGSAWLKLDLGAQFSVTSVRPTFTDSRLRSFVVEGSTDNQTWLPLADRQTGLVGNHFTLDVSGRYRYVRLLVTAAEGDVPAGVRELIVTGAAEIDLALGRPATASSQLGGYEAGKAVDGDSSSYWVAGNSGQSQWLTVDLGAARSITAVEQQFKDASWVNFTIRGSNDNQNWTELARQTPPAQEPRVVRGQTYNFPVAAAYRYVQLNVTATENGQWVASVSFRILGPVPAGAERDLALGVAARSSSVIDNQTPAKAVDGAAGTAWVADDAWQTARPGQPQWLFVDLGNKASVSRIEQSFVDSSNWTFSIQASPDKLAWTTITAGTQQGRVFSFPVPGTAFRYFQLRFEGKSTGNHWPSSQSFKVIGNGSPVTTRWWMDHGAVMRYYPKHYKQTLNSIAAQLDDLKRKGYQAIELTAPYKGPWTPWAGLGATDNYDIDPAIGTMGDFHNLLADAKAKGIKVILFGNLGYASPEAPFFQKAEREPNSAERKWFDFIPAPNGASDCRNNGSTGYFYSATARACYWVQWSAPKEPAPGPGEDPQVHMPAYNFANPEWRAEAEKVLRFWLDKGIDGFGADAPRVYRNITTAISRRHITDVINSYDVWSLPEGLQPDLANDKPADLLNGIPELHYNVIHDLFINHWGCPGGKCSRIIPAIDAQNPSALEGAFKASRDAINQQGGITVTMPSWELDDLADPARRVPADKRLLEIATLTTTGSQFYLHFGNHRYLPHVETIPRWTSGEQEKLNQLLRAQTNNAALQPRGLRVKLRTNDDNKYYAYQRTSRDGGATALVVLNYQNTDQQVTVDLSNLGISMKQTPVDLLTGLPAATPITGSSYTVTLKARQFAVLGVVPSAPRQPLADGTYRVRAEVSGPAAALDVTDCQTQDGADVRIWQWIPTSPCQDWRVTKVAEPDVYTIADGNTGKVLDVAGCSTANATVVHLWPYAGRNCQQWRIRPASDGAWQVIGVGSGKSLDVAGCSQDAGADVIIWPYHGGSCQRWRFES